MQIKYCNSSLRAVDHANLRGGKGYDVNRVVAIQCWHMMIKINGIGRSSKRRGVTKKTD